MLTHKQRRALAKKIGYHPHDERSYVGIVQRKIKYKDKDVEIMTVENKPGSPRALYQAMKRAKAGH